MNVDDELTPREHSEMRDLVLAGTQRIPPAGSGRMQFVAAAIALTLVGAVTGGILTVAFTHDGPPAPVASGDTSQDSGSSPSPTATDVDLQQWISDLPTGAPPRTPYMHDGVLHINGVEIDSPFPIADLEVAGETVLIRDLTESPGAIDESALVRDNTVTHIPVSPDFIARLSLDGQIAFWQTKPTPDTTKFVMWDVVSNRELATRTVSGQFDMADRVQVIGVDADGIAYWVNTLSDPPVMRWDVRADTVEPTDLRFDSSKSLGDQTAPLSELWLGFEDAYVSPDATRQLFTEQAPWDSPEDCCETQLRVRPVGPLDSVESDSVTTLQLPQGILGMRLWDPYSDRGTWGVWWETNETVLLDAIVDDRSYLVRCWADGGRCELVFDLGPNASSGILYMPEWERSWAFGRSPLTE